MCGIYLQISKKGKNRPQEYDVCGAMKSRGPDDKNIYRNDNIRLIHTRLAISHNSKKQPAIYEGGSIIIAFNGEIYNNNATSVGMNEIDYIHNMYMLHGANYGSYLEGEFAIIIIDLKRRMLHITRDFFGTKPLFAKYEDGILEVCTIADQLKKNKNENEISMVPSNKTLSYLIETLEQIGSRKVVNVENISSENKIDWGKQFRKELIKRWPLEAKTFIPLSSGHDSGLIAAVAEDIGYKSVFYMCPRGENLNILAERLEYLHKRGNRVIVIDLEDKYEQTIRNTINAVADHVPYIDEVFRKIDPVRDDPSPIGLASIFKHASKTGYKVAMSGQGGDEIYSGGYGGFGPEINVSRGMREDNGKLPYELYPWRHLKEGRMQQYLLKEEVIASIFSIETRYPLLSISSLISYMYNYQAKYRKFYKGPIEEELIRLNFPVDLTRMKRGFNPYSMDRSKEFLEIYKQFVIRADEIWQ